MHPPAPKRVLKLILVDDHPIVRAGMRALLAREPDMAILAEANDGLQAVALARDLNPDLVVMDFSLPGLNGAEATRKIRRARPTIKVLGISMHEDVPFASAMLDAGAAGFLLKRTAAEELARAVRMVSAGDTYVDSVIARQLLERQPRRKSLTDASKALALSERELEVARLLASGATMKEIAEQLGVSPRTLETYRARAMEKLGLKTRADLVRYAVGAGWLRMR